MKKTKVEISKKALKEVEKLPLHIALTLQFWIESVSEKGLAEIRKVAGYHDEPLKGQRLGQRSVRLNSAYRVFYIISASGEIEIVTIIEVNKHKY